MVSDLVIIPVTPSPLDFSAAGSVVTILEAQAYSRKVEARFLITRKIEQATMLSVLKESIRDTGVKSFRTAITQRQIQNKDVVGAMRMLRDKSEFAVRKILGKLKFRVTTQTGRAFWHYVQGWLLNACRQGNIQHESFSTRRPSQYLEHQPAQSCSSRYGQASRTYGHDYRPHQ